MNTRYLAILALPLALALGACGEKPQTLGQGSRQDTPAFQGPASPFTAAGWKPGDRTSWEQQIHTRQQQGQNEYNRIY